MDIIRRNADLQIPENAHKDVTDAMIAQLSQQGETAIYVADYETDELLFLNAQAKAVLHIEGEGCPPQKCYEYLMRRREPCSFCHKPLFSSDKFYAKVMQFPANNRYYRISSKISQWGNRKVHVHYINDVTELMVKEKELQATTEQLQKALKRHQKLESSYNQLMAVWEHTADSNLVAKGVYDLNKNRLLKYKRHGQESLELMEGDFTFANEKESSEAQCRITYDLALEQMVATAALPMQAAAMQTEIDRERLIQAYEAGITHGSLEYKRKEAQGIYLWTKLEYYLCANPNAEGVVFFVYTYDITKKILEKNMLRMLNVNEYELMGILDVATGIYETKSAIKNIAGYDKYIGYDRGSFEATIKELIYETLPEYEQQKTLSSLQLNKIIKALDEKGSYFVTYTIVASPTSLQRKKLQFCYLDEEKTTIFYYRTDITDIYTKEQEQIRRTEEALKIAKAANASKTEFFSRMSHDMRTPMNGILGLAGLAKDENDPAALKTTLSKIYESGTYLLSLINDTLDFQRIESGKLSLELQPVYTQGLIESIKDMVATTIAQKQIEFTVNQGAQVNVNRYLMIDPIRIRQIFVNLLSNAIKFTPPGGRIQVDIDRVELTNSRVSDVITIKDTGVGMSRDFVEHKLFKAFAQEVNEQSFSYAGSGLGLSIVHSLVQMMGGKIEVESELGSGTTFRVYLTFEYVEKELIESLKKKAQVNESTASAMLAGRHILLAEDHPLNAEIATKLLERVGCSVCWVHNGKECVEAVAKAKENTYDMVLMDIRMPVMDGLQAAAEIRRLPVLWAKHLPILAMTANAYDEDTKKSLRAGMNGHISKPIVPKVMFKTMADTLAQEK